MNISDLKDRSTTQIFLKCEGGEWEAITIHDILNNMTQNELRTLRAIINGKLSKRKITPEQQAKMQAARQKVD